MENESSSRQKNIAMSIDIIPEVGGEGIPSALRIVINTSDNCRSTGFDAIPARCDSEREIPVAYPGFSSGGCSASGFCMIAHA